MDTEPDELRFLHTIGILKESFKILRGYYKLFASLAFSFVLPLCFVLLAHNLVTEPLVHRIRRDEAILSDAPGTVAATQKQRELLGEWIKLILFFLAYLLFVLAFSLLSTAAVVYSVACIYTERQLSYSKVLTVVPRVWKRLMITFFWVFLLMTAYQTAGVLSIRILVYLLGDVNTIISATLISVAAAFFLLMLVFLTCIWHLASVITVLEESYGLGAIRNSVRLIKGKRTLAYSLFFLYMLCTFTIGAFFHYKVVHGRHNSVGRVPSLIYGVVLILLLSFVTLIGMLVQTVFYFACKSYHHENIDRLALSEHLGTFLGEYMPLKGSIQMQMMEEEP